MHEQEDTPKARAWMLIAALVLIAALLRVLGIQHESAWWDEYSSLMHLKEASLWSFLMANRTHDPATLPLYYTIEFLWARLFGTDTLALRGLSLLFGLALLPAVYVLGGALHSRRAGLLAAACVALSPIHIFHAQGIRMYVLFALLAVISMWTYARLRAPQGVGWRLPHVAAQFLLSWTHPFAVLVPAVQGVAWLAAGKAERPACLRWAGLTALAWLPVLIYLATVRYYPVDVVNWIRTPNMAELAVDLLADDIVQWGYDLYPSDRAWAWAPYWLAAPMRAAYPLFNVGLVAVFAGGVAWGLLQLRALATHRRAAVLLLAWLVFPVLALYAASLLARPMIAPRYTLHSSIALYLLAAAAIFSLPRPPRIVAAIALLALLSMQTALTYPGPQRTNYLEAGRSIVKGINPDTGLILITSAFERPILEYNVPLAGLPVVTLEGMPLALLAAHAALSGSAPLADEAWIVHVVPYWQKIPEVNEQEALASLGLDAEITNLPGIQGIRLLRMAHNPGGASALGKNVLVDTVVKHNPQGWAEELLATAAGLPADRAPAALLAMCGLCSVAAPDAAALLCGPLSATDASPLVQQKRARALSAFLRGAGSAEGFSGPAGQALLDHVLAEDASFGMALIMRGMTETSEGNVRPLMDALAIASAADPGVEQVLGEYIAAISAGNATGAIAASGKMPSMGPDMSALFRDMAPSLCKAAKESTHGR